MTHTVEPSKLTSDAVGSRVRRHPFNLTARPHDRAAFARRRLCER